jgi:hypothetical protein
MRPRPWFPSLALTLIGMVGTALGADPTIRSPIPHQVIQREHFDPIHAHAHNFGAPALGDGLVPIVAEFPNDPQAIFEYRAVPRERAFGKGCDWIPLECTQTGNQLQGQARVPAGGWYRLEVRQVREDGTTTSAAMEPIGVGEVFIVAGQSYAEGANEAHLKIDDPDGRVVALDLIRGTWGVANDPQPNAGPGGTIWPPMGNALLPLIQVPIGFINVASGGTASRQWLPGTALYERLEKAGRVAGRFRAVLWQQGESDVIENVDKAKYVANLKTIRSSLADSWKFEPVWLLAKSTMHPYVYNEPYREWLIRVAIDQLWASPGFGPGPDTDTLADENRADRKHRTHFSKLGQERAGLLWLIAVWNEIHQPHNQSARSPQ